MYTRLLSAPGPAVHLPLYVTAFSCSRTFPSPGQSVPFLWTQALLFSRTHQSRALGRAHDPGLSQSPALHPFALMQELAGCGLLKWPHGSLGGVCSLLMNLGAPGRCSVATGEAGLRTESAEKREQGRCWRKAALRILLDLCSQLCPEIAIWS